MKYLSQDESYGSETLRFLGRKMWNIVPSEYKNTQSLNELKDKVKTWVPKECSHIIS